MSEDTEIYEIYSEPQLDGDMYFGSRDLYQTPLGMHVRRAR